MNYGATSIVTNHYRSYSEWSWLPESLWQSRNVFFQLSCKCKPVNVYVAHAATHDHYSRPAGLIHDFHHRSNFILLLTATEACLNAQVSKIARSQGYSLKNPWLINWGLTPPPPPQSLSMIPQVTHPLSDHWGTFSIDPSDNSTLCSASSARSNATVSLSQPKW